MLIASGVFFIFPCCLLVEAWRRALLSMREEKLPIWRSCCIGIALVLATAATIVSMIDIFSWFHNGGSPHGMGPGTGLWIKFGPHSLKLEIAALLAGIFGVGKGRWFLLGVGPSLFLVQILLPRLEMD